MKLEAHVRFIVEVYGSHLDPSEMSIMHSDVFPTSFTWVQHKNMESTIQEELEWHFKEWLPDSITKLTGYVEVIAEFWGRWWTTEAGEGDSECELRGIRHRQLSKEDVEYFELDEDQLF